MDEIVKLKKSDANVVLKGVGTASIIIHQRFALMKSAYI